MTTPAEVRHHMRSRMRYVITGPEGFLRMVVVLPGRHGTQLERTHTNNVNDALQLCTVEAAGKIVAAIGAHFPLVDPGYKVLAWEDQP